MAAETSTVENILIPDAPAIPGLHFRYFAGEQDFPAMISVRERADSADGTEEVHTVENMAKSYANLKNCDPHRDVVLAEIDGEVVAYKRVFWYQEIDGTYIYNHFYFMVPEWRGKGLEHALTLHSEARLREISQAEGHPVDSPRLYDTFAFDTQTERVNLLAEEGYTPIRHAYDMVRPDLENIPDCPLPAGIEVRPVRPEEHHAIWEAEVEAFQDHWGVERTDESDFERWKSSWPLTFQPHLWQVAWDGDQVTGMVRNFIVAAENQTFNRKRGYTEFISVRRPWRKRGLAKALIARSFKMLKDLGMEEAALSVDAENPNGALQLYESLGFRTTKHSMVFRKPMK